MNANSMRDKRPSFPRGNVTWIADVLRLVPRLPEPGACTAQMVGARTGRAADASFERPPPRIYEMIWGVGSVRYGYE